MKDLIPWLGEFILIVVGSFLGSYLSYKVKSDGLKFEKQKYNDKKQDEVALDNWVKTTPIEPYHK